MDPALDSASQSLSWRFRLIVVIAALLLGAAAYAGANKHVLGLFHDDGIYAVIAKALSEGGGYRIVSLPGTPPQTKYPFIYPILLYSVWSPDSNFPDNIGHLKGVNISILVALFLVCIVFYRRNSSDAPLGAILFGLLVCVNPIIFTLTDYVLSDLLLVFLAVVALTYCSGRSGESSSWIHPALFGAVAGVAGLTRMAGVSLAIAGAAYYFFTRRFRYAIYFVASVLLFVGPWLVWIAVTPREVSGSLFDYYVTYDLIGAGGGDIYAWTGLVSTLLYSNARYLSDVFELAYLLPILPGFAPFIVLFSIIGIFVSLRKDMVFILMFFAVSLAILLLWPFHPGRYTAPLIPVLILFLFRGIRAAQLFVTLSLLRQDVFKWWVTTLLGTPLFLLLFLDGIWLSSFLLITDNQTTRGFYGSRMSYGWQGFEETFAWLRQHTQSDSILATAYDPMYFLYTGRQAIRPTLHRPATYFYPYGRTSPDVGSVEEIQPQLKNLNVRFLIMDPLDGYAEGKATQRLLDQLVGAYGERAKLVFTSSDGKHRIYALD